MKSMCGAARAVAGGLLSVVLLGMPAVSAAGIKIQNANYDADGGQVIIKGKVDTFGDAVTVVARNLISGEILGDSVTDKQFLYKVPVTSMDQVPCEVIVTVGSDANTVDEFATTEVRNGPVECAASYEVTLAGLVTDEPVPFATVSVTLDGVTYTTTADENGFYELDLVSANLNQLVRIDAFGETAETGEPIDFVNLTGSFSRVLDGNATGNVTNVTTASYVLTVEANGGTEPTTAEELATAETSVDATELFQLAALIKLIVDDPQYKLPEGETNLIEFISDPVAVDSFAATVPQEDLDKALGDILADSNLVAGFTAEDIPERYYAIPVAEPDFIAREGDALEFDTAGTGAFLSKNNLGEGIAQDFLWFIDGGQLVIKLNDPVVAISFPSIDDIQVTEDERIRLFADNITQVEETRAETQITYTRITDGTLVDIARVETRVDISYPPVTLADGSIVDLSRNNRFEISSSNTTLRASLDIEPIPFSDTCNAQVVCVVGVWGGDFHYPESPGVRFNGFEFPATAYGDLMTFSNDGSAMGLIGASSATWSIGAEGELIIAYANGMVQTMRALDENNGEYGIYSDYNDGNTRFASYSVYTRADLRPVLTEQDVESSAASYYNGEINSWIRGSFDENGAHIPDRRFGWQLDAGGSARRFLGFIATDRDGVPECVGRPANRVDPVTWTMDQDGNVELRYYNRIRNWYPAALGSIAGDRVIYVIEVDQFDWGGVLVPPRLNIQREIPEYGDWCTVFDFQ